MSHPTQTRSRALAALGMLLAACITSQAQDILSVNFYDYGPLAPGDRDKVTLEAGESAGVGSANTTGWENYKVPWAPTSPQAPVTITSTYRTEANGQTEWGDVTPAWRYGRPERAPQ